MGVLTVPNAEGKQMEARSARSTSSTKTERKVIEKNRRNQMKTLYSKLNSLLPSQPNKEAQSLPDRIDEAINYIKSLEAKLKKSKEKKESLTGSRKRSYNYCTNNEYESVSSLKSPQLQIREMGSALEIVLVTGLHNQFSFNDIIRILYEEGLEVVSASFQLAGNNSIFHVVHAQMSETAFGFGAATISDRLNRFINGSTSSTELDSSDLWDFDIHPETWEF